MEEKRYDKLGMRLWRGELENGLRVYVDVRPGYGKQFAFFATRYGGLDTRFQTQAGWQDTPAGVAHFLEHKLIDTKDGNALQIMAANGADPNAFTSFDITGYFFQCTQGFEENLRTLLGFVTEPYFTPESVAKEQGIIGQEIAMGDDEADTEDGEEMTQKEVADLLGISQSYISRLEKKIMKRLKKEIVRFE